MNNSAASKRRNVFIKKAFQTRFMLGAVALVLLASLCSALLIYWMTGGDLESQSQSAHASIVTAWEHLGISILLGNVVAVAVAGAAGVRSVLYASHKIAGPLYRFESLCNDIAAGKLQTVTQLREGDQLQELSVAFANMVTKLRSQRDLRVKHLANINQQIGLCAMNSDNLSTEQKNAVDALAELVAELEKLDR